MTHKGIKRPLVPLHMQGDQWRVIMLEMMDSSDRATIVTAAATLDALLAQLLSLLLIEDRRTDHLLKAGALKYFGPRITMSYCLGLISEDERADLETIQQLRNDFAHNWLEGSFGKSPTSEACYGLRYAEKWKDELAHEGWSDSARDRFIVTVFGLVHSLLLRTNTRVLARRGTVPRENTVRPRSAVPPPPTGRMGPLTL